MIIPLTQGFVTRVSGRNPRARKAAKLKWCAQRAGKHLVYAVRGCGRHRIFLHQFLVDAPEGATIDHRNGDTLNNLDTNLRFATRAQQSQSFRTKSTGKTSKFRGVSLERGRWRARVQLGGRKFSVGVFLKEEDAARARDIRAIELFGSFAHLNFL